MSATAQMMYQFCFFSNFYFLTFIPSCICRFDGTKSIYYSCPCIYLIAKRPALFPVVHPSSFPSACRMKSLFLFCFLFFFLFFFFVFLKRESYDILSPVTQMSGAGSPHRSHVRHLPGKVWKFRGIYHTQKEKLIKKERHVK